MSIFDDASNFLTQNKALVDQVVSFTNKPKAAPKAASAAPAPAAAVPQYLPADNTKMYLMIGGGVLGLVAILFLALRK